MDLMELAQMPWVIQKADEFVEKHRCRMYLYLREEETEIRRAFLAGIREAEGPEESFRWARSRMPLRRDHTTAVEFCKTEDLLIECYLAGRNFITHERQSCCGLCEKFEV